MTDKDRRDREGERIVTERREREVGQEKDR
jgi:hypothetical protein